MCGLRVLPPVRAGLMHRPANPAAEGFRLSPVRGLRNLKEGFKLYCFESFFYVYLIERSGRFSLKLILRLAQAFSNKVTGPSGLAAPSDFHWVMILF